METKKRLGRQIIDPRGDQESHSASIPGESTKMTAKGKTMYQLFNETDGVFASPETFKTTKQAEAYADKFRDRFGAQGYYLTAAGTRIAPSEIVLRVVPVNS